MGMWTNTHCFDFQIFWAGGTTGMTYLYYIYFYIYYIIYTGPYIIYCIQVFPFCGVSSSAAGSLVLGFFKMNTVT